jgi:hypothetical protein
MARIGWKPLSIRRVVSLFGGSIAIGSLAWAAYAAASWLRYGRTRDTTSQQADPLDSFIPDPEVDEVHQAMVGAPAAVALQAAKELDLNRSPLVWLILSLRTLPARVQGAPTRWETPGLVEETLRIGWGVLSDTPGKHFIAGAVTRPWETVVRFRAVAPEEFAGFEAPGYAKIVWTLEADALSERESVVRTRTRVKTTDPESRRRFRRYWAVFSPGILLIRREALRLVRHEAPRMASAEVALGSQ